MKFVGMMQLIERMFAVALGGANVNIREITFEVRERDKGEFDSVGGYAQFRKDNFGTLKLANEGASVDSVYAELQNLYVRSISISLTILQRRL